MHHSAYYSLKLLLKNTAILMHSETPVNDGTGKEDTRWYGMPVSLYNCTPGIWALKSLGTFQSSACIVVCSVAEIGSEIFLCYQSKHYDALSFRGELSHLFIAKRPSVIFHAQCYLLGKCRTSQVPVSLIFTWYHSLAKF